MSTNNKTVTAPTLLARLAAAKEGRKAQVTATAAGLRAQLESAVGALNTLPALEAIRSEARGSLEGEDLANFEGEVDRLVAVRKEFERAEAEARRLGLVATPDNLKAYLDRKVQNELKEKEAELKAKELADKAKAKAAREEVIASIIAHMEEGKEKPLTEAQVKVLAFFLRGNPAWKFTPTPAGKNALLRAAEAASAAFRKDHKIKARAVKAARAEADKAKEEAEKAAAPLTHNIQM